MTRTSLAQGRTATGAPTEWDVIYRPNAPTTEGIIFCHGSGHTATTTFTTPETNTLLELLATRAVVVAGDFGLQSWGNNTGITRVHEAVTYMESIGLVAPFTIVTGSMGNATGCAYTLAHPDKVKAIAGIIPLCDIADVRLRGAQASVDAAYPPTYNDTTDGPTHSPIKMATTLPANLPIHLWGASDDTIVPPATLAAFIAARPQTGFTNLGAVGHTNAAVTAATASVNSFVLARR